MDVTTALVLGVVQGVAEWLPISSKTQIMLVSQMLLGASPQFAYSLGLFLEAASTLAALIYFRWIYLKILRGLLGDKEGRKWLTYVVMTTAVTALAGIPLYYAAKRWLLVGAEVGWLMAALGAAVILNAVLLQGRGLPQVSGHSAT